MKKFVLAVAASVLVVVLIGGAAVYFLVLRDYTPEETKKKETLYNYVLEDYFVTNVRDSSKLFKISIVLVLDEDPEGAALAEELADHLYLIRDRLNVLLRTKTEADLTASNIEDTLRAEISDTVNEALDANYVVSASFTDFVMQ